MTNHQPLPDRSSQRSSFGPAGFSGTPERRSRGLARGIAAVLAGATVVGLTTVGHQDLRADEPVVVTTTSEPVPALESVDMASGVTKTTYKNESYKVPAASRSVPPLPTIHTWPEATALMRSNRLYTKTGARPIRCNLGHVDTTRLTDAQFKARMDAVTACLMRMWAPTLKSAGYTAVRPTVTLYKGTITTKCGRTRDYNAYYCSGDQQVYYARNVVDLIPAAERRKPYIAESILAHEFGHAVQARTGIFASTFAWESKSSKDAAKLLNRRLEMQADCFAGEFMASASRASTMSAADRARVGNTFYWLSDDVLSRDPKYVGDHGQGRNRRGWTGRGLNTAKLSTCNTYTAKSTTVR